MLVLLVLSTSVASREVNGSLVHWGHWFPDLHYHETGLVPLSCRLFFGLHELLELLSLLLSDLVSLGYRYWDSLWAYYCYGIGSILYTWLGCKYEYHDTFQSNVHQFYRSSNPDLYWRIYVTVAELFGSHGLMCLLGLCLLHWPPSSRKRGSDDNALLRAIPKLSLKSRSETTYLNLPMNDQSWNIFLRYVRWFILLGTLNIV